VAEALPEVDPVCVLVTVTVVDPFPQDATNAAKASLAAFLSAESLQTFCAHESAPLAKPGCAHRHASLSKVHPAAVAAVLAQVSAHAGRGPNAATARPMVNPRRTTSALRGAK